jgi:hypothetical protein
MQITSALGNALYGIKKGLTEIDKNAAKVAGAETFNSPNAVDVARPLVELQVNKLQIEASAKVMKSVDETLGSLIDVTA